MILYFTMFCCIFPQKKTARGSGEDRFSLETRKSLCYNDEAETQNMIQAGDKMDEILTYLDSIQIDVVKRKYYNANKVNAVFEEIRGLAENLVEENKMLQARLQEKEADEQRGQEEKASLKEVQETYRALLAKAHERAEAIVSDAEEYRSAVEKLAEQRCNYAAKQVEVCLNTLRRREEQNIEYLNSQMQSFLSELYDSNQEDGEEEGTERAPVPGKIASADSPAESSDEEPPEDLVSKINRLTREIKALETE